MSVRNQCPMEAHTAGEDLSSHQYGFVYNSAENVVKIAGSSQNAISKNVYILQNAPESGEVAEVCAATGYNSRLKVVDASAVVGVELMISTGGFGTVRVGVGKPVRAKVKEAVTAANQIVEVEIANGLWRTT